MSREPYQAIEDMVLYPAKLNVRFICPRCGKWKLQEVLCDDCLQLKRAQEGIEWGPARLQAKDYDGNLSRALKLAKVETTMTDDQHRAAVMPKIF